MNSKLRDCLEKLIARKKSLAEEAAIRASSRRRAHKWKKACERAAIDPAQADTGGRAYVAAGTRSDKYKSTPPKDVKLD
jgi:hypothetical protein